MFYAITLLYCIIVLYCMPAIQSDPRVPLKAQIYTLASDLLISNISVRLSLLTMTNRNQLCDVLLFVCSKMADETSLSSKLPVADITREV